MKCSFYYTSRTNTTFIILRYLRGTHGLTLKIYFCSFQERVVEKYGVRLNEYTYGFFGWKDYYKKTRNGRTGKVKDKVKWK